MFTRVIALALLISSPLTALAWDPREAPRDFYSSKPSQTESKDRAAPAKTAHENSIAEEAGSGSGEPTTDTERAAHDEWIQQLWTSP